MQTEQAPTDRAHRGYSFLFPEDGKSRPAALLVHGLTGAPHEMEDLGKLLHNKGFDVLVPCLSGHMESVKELKTVRAEEWFRDLETAFSALAARKPSSIVCAGLSFGGLLLLNLALKHSSNISAIVVMAPPLELRSKRKEYALRALSFLPDSWLDALGEVKKKRRDAVFTHARKAYDAHSIGALARLKWIQRQVLARSEKISCPILLLQDPDDHYLPEGAVRKLQQKLTSADVTQRWIAGAEHEMTIGPRGSEVINMIADFLIDKSDRKN